MASPTSCSPLAPRCFCLGLSPPRLASFTRPKARLLAHSQVFVQVPPSRRDLLVLRASHGPATTSGSARLRGPGGGTRKRQVARLPGPLCPHPPFPCIKWACGRQAALGPGRARMLSPRVTLRSVARTPRETPWTRRNFSGASCTPTIRTLYSHCFLQ